MILMLFVFKKDARVIAGFLMIGLFICLFAGELNALLFNSLGMSKYLFTVNITPVVEEFLKALPIIFFALLFHPNPKLLLECSVALGIGFAILENVNVLATSSTTISFALALTRGLGAGMVHGINGLIVGYAMRIITVRRKLILPGIIGILSVAIVYHSIYNTIVQSQYSMLGIILPSVTFIIGFITYKLLNKNTLS